MRKTKIEKYHTEPLENLRINHVPEYERAERTSYIFDAMEKLEMCWQMEFISDYHYNRITTMLANEISLEEIKEAEETD